MIALDGERHGSMTMARCWMWRRSSGFIGTASTRRSGWPRGRKRCGCASGSRPTRPGTAGRSRARCASRAISCSSGWRTSSARRGCWIRSRTSSAPTSWSGRRTGGSRRRTPRATFPGTRTASTGGSTATSWSRCGWRCRLRTSPAAACATCPARTWDPTCPTGRPTTTTTCSPAGRRSPRGSTRTRRSTSSWSRARAPSSRSASHTHRIPTAPMTAASGWRSASSPPMRVRSDRIRDSVALVRGVDTHGHFELEPEPECDFDPNAVEFHRWAEEERRKILYHGTDWQTHRT